MKIRGISIDDARRVIKKPGQVLETDNKRILQSLISAGGKNYLLRIFVNKKENLVITAYFTSKIHKYYES